MSRKSNKMPGNAGAAAATATAMEIEWWPIDKPIPYARNARKISQAAIDKVAGSIKEFGWRQPIVVDTAGVIVVGHTRLLAAQKLGLDKVPVHVAHDLTANQIRAYRLTDNRVHEESEWQDDLLTVELAELSEAAFDLTLTGFDENEITKLLGGTEDGEALDTAPQLGEALVYQLVVSCEGESQQARLLERLESEGYTCRALIS